MKSPPRILVVEDDIIIATDIKYTLTAGGFTVVGICSSGKKALARVAELAPDLILLDIMLAGGMDGVETGRCIRERFGIPFIYLTSNSDPATRERALATAPRAYLLKPFHEEGLRSAVHAALDMEAEGCGFL